MRILILGCGYVGNALGLRLVELGHQVWGARRDPGKIASPLVPVALDVAVQDSLDGLPDRFDLIFYTLAPNGPEEAAYRLAYADGPRNLLAWLERHASPPRRILMTCSTRVYGECEGAWVDEQTEPEPEDVQGALLLEGEQILAASRVPSIVIRLGGIYGPGRSGLMRRVREGRVRGSSMPHYSNRIHRDDAVESLLHLMNRPQGVAHELFLGVDREPADRNLVLDWMAERLKAPPVERDVVQTIRGKRCSNKALLESGYRMCFPTFREGYGAMMLGIASNTTEPKGC